MSALSALSPAKINLTLRVGPRRPDGYHDVESLVARVSLADRVIVEPRAAGALTCACDDPAVPADESNLVLRAARRLAERAAAPGGAHVTLEKRIPAGAGLGGGSSNAATTILLLSRLWELNWPRDRLAAIGAEVGSDVPLFFHAPLAILRGRGEVVQDVAANLTGWCVLVLPRLHSPTGPVYAAFDALPAPPARVSAAEILRHVGETRRRPARTASPADLSAEHLAPWLYNDLEPAAMHVTPALREVSERIRASSGARMHMSGSGAAMFALFEHIADAVSLAEHVRGAHQLRAEIVAFESR